MVDRLRRFENLHIAFWLVKDFCWIQDWKWAGTCMILPTLGMALYITYLSRTDRKELAHNLAVVCWICANVVWMLGEFYWNDTTRPQASLFFALGIMVLAWYYLLGRRTLQA